MAFDIDLDFGDKEAVLGLIPNTRAMMIQNGRITSHNSGAYVTAAPRDPVTNLCTYDYKTAEKMGYFKIDFLNNTLYTLVKSPAHLEALLEKEPNWKLLQNADFVQQIAHIGSYHSLITKLPEPICCLDHMAMFLALIRPGKRHLLGKTWQEIQKTVWMKETEGYQFKKSHAYAYGLAACVNMNLVEEMYGEHANTHIG